jgi:hypothetical protein
VVHRAAGQGAGADRDDDFGADFIRNGQERPMRVPVPR